MKLQRPYNLDSNKLGFTLIELVVVVCILSISVALFYGVLYSNWFATETYINQADLMQEMNTIIDQATADGRLSNTITVNAPANTQAIFQQVDAAGVLINPPLAIYNITPAGALTVTRAGVVTTLSTNINPATSLFAADGRGVIIQLALTTNVLGATNNIVSSTEIFPRN